ncbi:DUF2252 domain-containing protein [Rhizobium sp. 57MFTsu3.2]|uniref:DUF2252 domain-containing protein n=1 Tax=Rhizobium sp. 57MFTsu3.2 TaxID=1048681 RepID=UPI00146A8F80|nr:DUF2252 domain-containing protein [Rhizobium sp. 57MFTsu3.2]NMN71417.1 uncharacterized protein (DUF2252 family) [Rhizobium sp. 57MFTsu3.2]
MVHAEDATKTSVSSGSGHSANFVTPNARLAEGKALRDKILREQQGRWNEIQRRRDPIDLLRESDDGRMKKLIPIRYGRMLPSPFAFYRGAAGVMAADLAQTPATGLKVQACGDCHLVNFGGFATPERSIIFDINDFDETAPAPWEWDVKRLVASVVLAARSNGISDHRGRDSAVNCARRYREHMRKLFKKSPLAIWYAKTRASDFVESLPTAMQGSTRKRIEKAANRSGSESDFPNLAASVGGQIRITDQPPLIFHERATSTPEAEVPLEQLLHIYRQSLDEDRRMLLDRYQLVDVAIKVVGVGSVGRRCWIALMMSEGNHPLFLQFKEAVNSVLEAYAGKSKYDHHGQRVVIGQRLMQPASDIFLGWVTAPNGRQFYVRQLHDAKIKPLVDTFDAEMLDAYAQACGWVLARAHAKASEISATISGYLGSSNDAFDTAMGSFALAYADQTERDHALLKAAVREGRIAAIRDA